MKFLKYEYVEKKFLYNFESMVTMSLLYDFNNT